MSPTIALTHVPSPKLVDGERTYVARDPIDFAAALREHTGYRALLAECGAEVRTLDVNRDFPDSVFIEDTAIVLDELAVMMSMGAESRRPEPGGIEPVLREYREIERVDLPACIDGGDVVMVGRRVLVGASSRTNRGGIEALRAIVRRCGYEVTAVPVTGCLHLKTACTALPDGRLVVNRALIEVGPLAPLGLVDVPPSEPYAADVALVNARVIVSAEHPRTAALLDGLGFQVRPVEVFEFAKAEGGVTCMSLIFEA
jgi:dimethylargininase